MGTEPKIEGYNGLAEVFECSSIEFGPLGWPAVVALAVVLSLLGYKLQIDALAGLLKQLQFSFIANCSCILARSRQWVRTLLFFVVG